MMKNLKVFRDQIRQGKFTGHTSGLFSQFAQANVFILPQKDAKDFRIFCQLNTIPCPVIYESKPGEYYLEQLGEIDIRSDVPMYLIYKQGRVVEETSNIVDYWNDDMVGFYLGCSFTFEQSLLDAGIKLPHIEQKKNVAMYHTNIALKPSGFFSGNMVVSMRWISRENLEKAYNITKKHPNFHGAPIHHGDSEKIGILDITTPEFGDYVEPHEDDDIPVFWGCGVTPQMSITNACLDLVITHKPGSMLITDLTHEEILN